jgi:hypothetical protein
MLYAHLSERKLMVMDAKFELLNGEAAMRE